jgi:uncharacterized membrane protein YqjE
MEINEARVQSPGLLGGITSLAKNLAGLAVSRVELAALELTEVRNHVIELLAIFADGGPCSPGSRWPTAPPPSSPSPGTRWAGRSCWSCSSCSLVLTAILVMKGLSMLKQGKLAFPETMKELRNDRDMLGKATGEHGQNESTGLPRGAQARAAARRRVLSRGVAHARAQIKHDARPEVMFHTALDHATWVLRTRADALLKPTGTSISVLAPYALTVLGFIRKRRLGKPALGIAALLGAGAWYLQRKRAHTGNVTY